MHTTIYIFDDIYEEREGFFSHAHDDIYLHHLRRIGSPPIFITGRHGDLLIANLSQGRSGSFFHGSRTVSEMTVRDDKSYLCLDVSFIVLK